jgi:hypothetical protein
LADPGGLAGLFDEYASHDFGLALSTLGSTFPVLVWSYLQEPVTREMP